MKLVVAARIFYKSHIETYTKKDGTVVRAHDDKRAAKKPAKGQSYRLFEEPSGNKSHDPWTDEQWAKLRLDEGNTNAATHHRLLDDMRAKAAAGDIQGLKNMAHGANTYGKKRALIAQHLVGSMEAARPAKILVSKEVHESNLTHNRPTETKPESKMKDGQISYTFANSDAVPAPLRGKTLTGGKLENHLLGGKLVEVFSFKEKINGQPVAARVAGKPELEAAASEIKAAAAKAKADARQALETAVPGLPQYEDAMKKWSKAQAEYDKASEYGYPGKAAAAASAADDELTAVMAKYPATAMWRKIEAFTQASNYSKSAAGDAAKKAVMAGTPIADAVKKMEAEWNGAAHSAAMNS